MYCRTAPSIGFAVSLGMLAMLGMGTTAIAIAPDPQVQRDFGALERMTASVALFPDPLLAQVLAASNYAPQIVRANDLISSGAVPAQTQSLDWPASVQTLASAPDLLANLAAHREWLQSLNQSLRWQSNDVFRAIQAMRQRAIDGGSLVNSSSIRVVTAGQVIRIEPASPSSIPIPSYSVDQAFSPNAGSSAIAFTGSLPRSAIREPLEIDWANGRIAYSGPGTSSGTGAGSWSSEVETTPGGPGSTYQGSIGRDDRGNISASGTTYVVGGRPGYEGQPWRPSGTVVNPGSISTQGHPLEITPPLPPVSPAVPLMPARPVQPVKPLQPIKPIRPISPVQPTSFRPPLAPIKPIKPVPSNIPGVYSPLPWGWGGVNPGWSGGWSGQLYGDGAFSSGGGVYAGTRGAGTVGGWSR
jgi:hypothetical protein